METWVMGAWGIPLALAAVLLSPRLGLDWRPAKVRLWMAVLLLSLPLLAPALSVNLLGDFPRTRVLVWAACLSNWLGTILLFMAFLGFARTPQT
jgi:hypothetical protein